MTLPGGSRLGPYEILAPLGAGGMGEVYRARDPRLAREVAIKVLPSDRLSDQGRRRRFVQEARAASQLNHPSIVTIHEIEREGDVDFIVMELVSGRSLDKLIPKGGMPLGEALRLAVPIADALSRAHAAGIVHRDLKPANVVVSDGGAPKILDFGLAKLLAREDVADEDTLSEESAASPLSQPGVISGTPAYMSPEQATGKPVDARSDVFSFGSVLYEMVTGRRPFVGASRRETLQAVASDEPRRPSEIATGVPAELEKLILRCLRKDPDRRFQHMDDVRVALNEIHEESASGAASLRAPPRGGRSHARALGWAVAVVIATAVLALVWRGRTPTTQKDAASPLTQVTWDAGLTTDPAPSAAGNLLAYASDREGGGNLDIWVRPLPSGEAIRLTRSEADDDEPSFSPDGTRIVFRSDRDGGGIYLVSALGGRETLVAPKGRGPRFSPDGTRIAYYVGDTILSGGAVFVVPVSGGEPRQLGAPELRARRPLWSPDGTHLLCAAFRAFEVEWLVLPVAGGRPVQTGAGEALRRAKLEMGSGDGLLPDAWSPGAEAVLLSARSGDTTNIWELPLSPRTWKVTGAPRQVTSGTGMLQAPSVAGDRVFFTAATGDVNLWSVSIDRESGKAKGELAQVTREPGRDHWPSISHDGRRVAFLSERSGTRDVWIKDLESGREVNVTGTSAPADYPRISADGSKVAYLLSRADARTAAAGPTSTSAAPYPGLPPRQRGNLLVASISPTGELGVTATVCEDCGRSWDWSRDGRYLLYRAPGALTLLEVGTGLRTEIVPHTRVVAFDPRFSPDDRWIAFTVQTSPTTRQNVVVPFRGPEPIPESAWIPVSDGRALDRQVAWSADGRILYFHSERDGFRCIWAQRLDRETKRAVGYPFPVLHLHGSRRSMTTAIGDPGSISISVGDDRMVFSLGDLTGNIWSTTY
jgi:Tol biopolymer transport system component/tRNA A-37 threonylcarbamoyl transferase component Bud32